MAEKRKQGKGCKQALLLPCMTTVVFSFFCIAISPYILPLGVQDFIDNLFQRDVSREIKEIEASIFLIENFDLELPPNAGTIHVWTNNAENRISLWAKSSFSAPSQDVEMWLNNFYTCTTSDSFEESSVTLRTFQWDDAPDWWYPETASNVILGHGCLPSNWQNHLHYILVNTDNSEIWTVYIVTSFP